MDIYLLYNTETEEKRTIYSNDAGSVAGMHPIKLKVILESQGYYIAGTKIIMLKVMESRLAEIISIVETVIPGSVSIAEFNDSIEYSPGIRNAYGKYKFTYSGTTIQIAVNPLLYPYHGLWSVVDVYVNGVFNKSISFSSKDYATVILPAGANKEILLVEGVVLRYGNIIAGTYITDIIADGTFVKIPEAQVTDKLVVLGGSIVHGAMSETPSRTGVFGKFLDAGKNVAMYGYVYGVLYHFAGTAGNITKTVTDIQTLFANTTGAKKLLIGLGKYDATLSQLSAVTFKTWYGNLLDAIYAADADIHIYCLSPPFLNQAYETSLLVDYRAGILDLTTTRAYTTYINGLPILTFPDDYAGDVYPHAAGQTKLYNALSAVIYP